ncbi:MAG: TIR domain-containing protein [Phycisphaerae bacterium]|nr:TIR domain-containing protein [Phycisphaerae bacterium]
MSDGPPSKPLPLPLSPTLAKSDADIKAAFRVLQSVTDVADLLEVRETQLTYAIWRTPEEKRYSTWSIRKRSGGTRTIDAPRKTHKILQRKLAYVLSLVAQRRSVAHGFSPGKSIVTNAAAHARCRWVFNADLKEFFPTINFGRVRGMLMGKPYRVGERAATAIAQLCCHKRLLPQGAPTSPVISNMVCARLDGELRRLAEHYGCNYTRYADDITFSTNKKTFPEELATLIGEGTKAAVGSALSRVIESNGFQVNPDKVRLQGKRTRQEVTGLVVNRRPNVRRAFVRQIRAMLHAWERYGYDAAQKEFLDKYDSKHRPDGASGRTYERVIRGKLAFLKQVRGKDDNRYLAMRRRLRRLLGEVDAGVGRGVEMEYDVFICHASEEKTTVVVPLAKALNDAGIRVWLDEEKIGWGDSVTKEINDGLAKSKFVVVVLSAAFMKKKWPAKEMNAVLNKEIASDITCALPLIVGDSSDKKIILETYPLLADKHYKEWSPSDIGTIVGALKAMLSRYA